MNGGGLEGVELGGEGGDYLLEVLPQGSVLLLQLEVLLPEGVVLGLELGRPGWVGFAE